MARGLDKQEALWSAVEVSTQAAQCAGQVTVWDALEELSDARDLTGCYCPGDCGCRSEFRANVCGCQAHR